MNNSNLYNRLNHKLQKFKIITGYNSDARININNNYGDIDSQNYIIFINDLLEIINTCHNIIIESKEIIVFNIIIESKEIIVFNINLTYLLNITNEINNEIKELINYSCAKYYNLWEDMLFEFKHCYNITNTNYNTIIYLNEILNNYFKLEKYQEELLYIMLREN